MREIIDLLETKEKLVQPKLPYSHSALAPVLSQANIDNHYGKLYKGYVDRFNNDEGDQAFNKAGAFLHDIFFSQLRAPKNANAPIGASLRLINQHFGSFVEFKKAMKAEVMKIQGSGWIYLSRSGQIKTIKNHAERKDIALLFDWWEHSWAIGYGADKAKYFDNLWRIVNWERVNRRIYSGK